MDYQQSVRQVSRNLINNSRLKAGHIYKNKNTGVIHRILGFTLDTQTLETMVIHSEVNNPIFSDLFNTPISLFSERYLHLNNTK